MTTHQLISFVLVVEQRLLQRAPDVCVRRGALEIGGRELGKFILGEVLLFLLRQRQGIIKVLLLHLLLSMLQILTHRASGSGKLLPGALLATT